MSVRYIFGYVIFFLSGNSVHLLCACVCVSAYMSRTVQSISMTFLCKCFSLCHIHPDAKGFIQNIKYSASREANSKYNGIKCIAIFGWNELEWLQYCWHIWCVGFSSTNIIEHLDIKTKFTYFSQHVWICGSAWITYRLWLNASHIRVFSFEIKRKPDISQIFY